jgi:hypothetical protein
MRLLRFIRFLNAFFFFFFSKLTEFNLETRQPLKKLSLTLFKVNQFFLL